MLTTVLAVAAAVLASATLVLVGLLLRRLRDDPDDQRKLAAGPASQGRTAGAEPRPPGTPEPVEGRPRPGDDLDAALEEALEHARAAVGTEAALLELDTPGGTPVVATLGLGRSEAEHLAGSLPPLTPSARSVTLTYPQPPTQDEPGEPIRSGLAVPVRAGSRRLGLLTVLSRGSPRGFDDADVLALEQVAEQSGAALARALDLRVESEGTGRDAVTGFVPAAGLPAALERAVAEARLRGGALSLVLIELDVLRQLAADDALDAVMADAAARLRDALRERDVACRPGRATIAVLLPGADAAEARELASRFQAAVASRPVGGAGAARPTVGLSTLAEADTPEALLERARRELGGPERRP